jgi:hypothetical protein
MASQSAVSRRAAQRATAARLREARQTGRPYKRVVPRAITAPSRQAQEQYARDVASGKIPEPAKGTPEARQLARMASRARWGKADPAFYDAFKKYFYHIEGQPAQPDEDEDVNEYYDEPEDDEEAE